MTQREQWEGFSGENWRHSIDVRDFIQENYTPYEGDESFLEGPTEATNTLWEKLQELQKEERAKGGVLDMETEVVTSLTAYVQKISTSERAYRPACGYTFRWGAADACHGTCADEQTEDHPYG